MAGAAPSHAQAAITTGSSAPAAAAVVPPLSRAHAGASLGEGTTPEEGEGARSRSGPGTCAATIGAPAGKVPALPYKMDLGCACISPRISELGSTDTGSSLASEASNLLRMADILEQQADEDFEQLRSSADGLLRQIHDRRDECRQLARKGSVRAWSPVAAACLLIVLVQPLAVSQGGQRQALQHFIEWAHRSFAGDEALWEVVPRPPSAPSLLQQFFLWAWGSTSKA